MFHTFQGVHPPQNKPGQSSSGSKGSGTSGSKRVTIPHACAECKRRKIRCDGNKPCAQCLSGRTPKECFYDKHRQRMIPSRKTLEALSQQVEEYRTVLKRLYPTNDVASLVSLSRKELLDLLDCSSTEDPDNQGIVPSPLGYDTPSKQENDSCRSSESGHPTPDPAQESSWPEAQKASEPIHSRMQSLNLFPSEDAREVSYPGASSVKVALAVMLKNQPDPRSSLPQSLGGVELTDNLPIIRRRLQEPKVPARIPWSWKGQQLVDAYFERVHISVPMINEANFRSDYLEGQRCDTPWLALLNVVLAMGCVISMETDNLSHIDYYNEALEHMTLGSLGRSSVEMVQAMAILGGFYLQYINKANMANALIGAAVRMASTLELHRECVSRNQNSQSETRRCTWWSLFCLDTWTTMTTGRPSFGRWVPAMNVQPPHLSVDQLNDGGDVSEILNLIENIKFCKIATQIQDMLAMSPLIPETNRRSIDAQLVSWYEGLPWVLGTSKNCPEYLYVSRCVMKWRYQNLRMLLHRPVLLAAASGGDREQDRTAIDICREMANVTIEDVSREWMRDQTSAWNAVLFLYQAVMVPLVSLCWERSSTLTLGWKNQVEMTLSLLENMEKWSLAARRCKEVVWNMYEASRPQRPQVLGDIMGDPRYLANDHVAGLAADDLGQGLAWEGVEGYWGYPTQPSIPASSVRGGGTGEVWVIDEGLAPADYAAMDPMGSTRPNMDNPFF